MRGFNPAVSPSSLKSIVSLAGNAWKLKPLLRGWIYYGRFAPSALASILRYVAVSNDRPYRDPTAESPGRVQLADCNPALSKGGTSNHPQCTTLGFGVVLGFSFGFVTVA